MAVRITYWRDAAFTEPLPCCPTDDIPPPLNFLSTDSFDEQVTLNRDDQGRDWFVDSGIWQETNGVALTIGQGLHIAHITKATAINCEIQVRLTPAGAGYIPGGVVARFTSLQNYYAAVFEWPWTVRILRVVNGVQKTLGTKLLQNSILKQLTFRLQDNRLDALANGAIALTVFDSSLPQAGYVGLYVENVESPSLGVAFDSWYAIGNDN